jgi:hypothetical protein
VCLSKQKPTTLPEVQHGTHQGSPTQTKTPELFSRKRRRTVHHYIKKKKRKALEGQT